jgi:hypothetical protein
MIIVGYQGIGKSTLAGSNNCIDLESGNFWVDGKRADDWYKPYCQIANHLSEQGYTVFTSSHEVVRKELEKSKEKVFVVFPAINLKDGWINKLRERYEATGLGKDFKALANAEDRYKENISELMMGNLKFYEITDMNYDLKQIIDVLKQM